MKFKFDEKIVSAFIIVIICVSWFIADCSYRSQTTKTIEEMKEEIICLKNQIVELESRIPVEDMSGNEGGENDNSNNNDNELDSNVEVEPKLISLGEFKLTAYCPCKKCCGKWAGSPTASGVMPVENHTIAVDTNVIPFGTEVIINGNTYVAEDTGSAIKGNKIDIYMESHETALEFGVQYAEIFVKER